MTTPAMSRGRYASEAGFRARAVCTALTDWARAGFAAGLFGNFSANRLSEIGLPSFHIAASWKSLLSRPGEKVDKDEMAARISYFEALFASVIEIEKQALEIRHCRVLTGLGSLGALAAAWLLGIVATSLIAGSTALGGLVAMCGALWFVAADRSWKQERRKFDALQDPIDPSLFLPWLDETNDADDVRRALEPEAGIP